MRVVKLHPYGVRTYPLEDGKLALEAPGKPRLEVATPSSSADEIWEPHELLIGALASCFELTAFAIARRQNVPIHAIRTDATGHVQSQDGRSRFVAFELDVEIETEDGCETAAESVAIVAHERCVVAQVLCVAVRLRVTACAAHRELATV
jgi:organic hydroperoxide reductase OsmC/OhrA